MNSSPDLSLKLRRESSGSRDSFYMDFAQGIDSDFEEIAAGGASIPKALSVHKSTLCETNDQSEPPSPTLPPIPSSFQEP